MTDLDGTLVVSGRIGASDRQAASRVKNFGIPILAITGRNFLSLRRIAGLWDVVDEILFSSGAGLWEHCEADPKERGRLSRDDVDCITNILDTECEDYCILDPIPHNHRFSWRRHRAAESNPDFDSRIAVYSAWSRRILHRKDVHREGSQLLVIRPPSAAKPVRLCNLLSEWSVFYGTSPLDGSSTWLEIFPIGLNKGGALSRRCKEKAIHPSSVLAIGNDYNDVSMLDWAGHSRVVEGAPADLKDRYTTLPPAGAGGFETAAVQAQMLFADQ